MADKNSQLSLSSNDQSDTGEEFSTRVDGKLQTGRRFKDGRVEMDATPAKWRSQPFSGVPLDPSKNLGKYLHPKKDAASNKTVDAITAGNKVVPTQ